MDMEGEACLPSNAYYPRTPDYTLYSGVHVCWSEHSDSSFVYGFMSLDYGLGTRTATTYIVPYLSWGSSHETLNEGKTGNKHWQNTNKQELQQRNHLWTISWSNYWGLILALCDQSFALNSDVDLNYCPFMCIKPARLVTNNADFL